MLTYSISPALLFYLLPKILPRTPLTMVLPIDLPIEEVMVLPVVLII
jgi:hypothetical protein